MSSPAESLLKHLSATGQGDLASIDGGFAAAWWDGDNQRLTMVRDPFGIRSLYYVRLGETFYFATELKQLLALPGLSPELDYAVLHKYLTFSFVPGEDVPIRGVRRLLPGHVGVFENGSFSARPYFTL